MGCEAATRSEHYVDRTTTSQLSVDVHRAYWRRSRVARFMSCTYRRLSLLNLEKGVCDYGNTASPQPSECYEYTAHCVRYAGADRAHPGPSTRPRADQGRDRGHFRR